MSTATIVLKPGRAKPLWLGHPWLFSQGIARVDGEARSGDLVRVVDPEGRTVGTGLYHADSNIAVRMVARGDEAADDGLFARRIERAVALRRRLGLPSARTDAFRLVNAEGDGLPGLNVDVYRDVVTVQVTSLGVERRLPLVVDALRAALSPRAIVRVGAGAGAEREGLTGQPGLLDGALEGDVEFVENGLRQSIDPRAGQKTGAFLDQRENRARVASMAAGARVLDLFTYLGGFALNALAGGARSAVAVDLSARAIERTRRHAAWAGFEDRLEAVEQDCIKYLEQTAARSFDLVVCDPPKFAPGRGALEAALKGYRRLNALAMRAAADGALLVTASCSQAVDLETFERTLASAAEDAKRRLTLLEVWFQGADHPLPLAFREGRYLKVVLCRVEG